MRPVNETQEATFRVAHMGKPYPMNENTASIDFVALAADIVSAYVSNNSVPTAELPSLINSVHMALAQTASGQTAQPAEPLVPAVSVKKSLTPDYIVCLEDGKKFKSLKRHLRTTYDLTPEQYRAKWGLPVDYPMVAPNYAKARSELAKTMGLGQQRKKALAAKSGAAPKGRRAKKAA
jgi:predicted transcriptional regulator